MQYIIFVNIIIVLASSKRWWIICLISYTSEFLLRNEGCLIDVEKNLPKGKPLEPHFVLYESLGRQATPMHYFRFFIDRPGKPKRDIFCHCYDNAKSGKRSSVTQFIASAFWKFNTYNIFPPSRGHAENLHKAFLNIRASLKMMEIFFKIVHGKKCRTV